MKKRKIVADTGSTEVQLMRLELNRLSQLVADLVAAAVTDGNTFQANVAALSTDDLELLVASPELPLPPLFPAKDV